MTNARIAQQYTLQVVILTRQMDASIAVYQRLLPVQPAAPRRLSCAQVAAWLAPSLAAAPVVALRVADDPPLIWLVECPAAQSVDPFRLAGWFGLTLAVEHLPTVADKVTESAFESLPDKASDRLCILGHNDEVIFLTQSDTGRCEVLSAVANVPDVETALLGYQCLAESSPVSGKKTLQHINRAWGFNGGRKHPVAEVAIGERHQLQFNELKAARIPASTEFFCGVFMVCTDNPLQPGTQVIKGTAGERLLSIQ